MGSEVRILSLRPTTQRLGAVTGATQGVWCLDRLAGFGQIAALGPLLGGEQPFHERVAQRVDAGHGPLASAPPREGQRADEGSDSTNVLVIDVGGTHVKILATCQSDKREFASGPKMTAEQMVSGVRQFADGWTYDVVSVGYPGPVLHDRPVADPKNLGAGWMGFDFKKAFGRPVKIINDAAMQALGGYRSGKMLFLGLGTGLGSTLIVDGVAEADGARSSALQESPPMRTMSASGGWSGWARKNGAGKSLTSSIDWSPRSNPTILCLAAVTPRYSTSCRQGAGWGTTRMRSEAGFSCGRAPRNPNCRQSNWALRLLRSCARR